MSMSTVVHTKSGTWDNPFSATASPPPPCNGLCPPTWLQAHSLELLRELPQELCGSILSVMGLPATAGERIAQGVAVLSHDDRQAGRAGRKRKAGRQARRRRGGAPRAEQLGLNGSGGMMPTQAALAAPHSRAHFYRLRASSLPRPAAARRGVLDDVVVHVSAGVSQGPGPSEKDRLGGWGGGEGWGGRR